MEKITEKNPEGEKSLNGSPEADSPSAARSPEETLLHAGWTCGGGHGPFEWTQNDEDFFSLEQALELQAAEDRLNNADAAREAMFIAIMKAQAELARYVVPGSGLSEKRLINNLLGILDDRKLVELLRSLAPAASAQPSPNPEEI